MEPIKNLIFAEPRPIVTIITTHPTTSNLYNRRRLISKKEKNFYVQKPFLSYSRRPVAFVPSARPMMFNNRQGIRIDAQVQRSYSNIERVKNNSHITLA